MTSECPYCDRRFTRERYRDLHRGQAHTERLDEAEREAFKDAYREEDAELRAFRLKALLALIGIYFGFIMLYALFA